MKDWIIWFGSEKRTRITVSKPKLGYCEIGLRCRQKASSVFIVEGMIGSTVYVKRQNCRRNDLLPRRNRI